MARENPEFTAHYVELYFLVHHLSNSRGDLGSY